MDNLPKHKRCCFCVPLRYGLLTWGYWKLAAALLGLAFFTLNVVDFSNYIIGDTSLISAIMSAYAVLTIDIVIHIILIIGAHKKNVKLLRVYFYYGLFMFVVSIILGIVSTALLTLALIDDTQLLAIFLTINTCSFLFYTVVQVLLLLSLRSEIIKLRSNCPYRFVKNDNEPEGTINSVVNEEDNMSTDNGTVRIL